jgi:hypothetical protein
VKALAEAGTLALGKEIGGVSRHSGDLRHGARDSRVKHTDEASRA